MLTFETTHEYYLGPNASLHYCSEHEALILTKDYEDRVLINGISNETMLDFASKTYKDSLMKECLKEKDKDAESKDALSKDVEIAVPSGTNLTKQAVSDRAG